MRDEEKAQQSLEEVPRTPKDDGVKRFFARTGVEEQGGTCTLDDSNAVEGNDPTDLHSLALPKAINKGPSPQDKSPSSPHSGRILVTKKEAIDQSKVGDIRTKFEDPANRSYSSQLIFGEAFRHKQRVSLLADKKRKREAKNAMHGYDEMALDGGGMRNTGEVDTSSIEKTFSFQKSDQNDFRHDGTCKYQNESYHSMVFVVHHKQAMHMAVHHALGH